MRQAVLRELRRNRPSGRIDIKIDFAAFVRTCVGHGLTIEDVTQSGDVLSEAWP